MDTKLIDQHTQAVQGLKIAHNTARAVYPASDGLASLQKSTLSLMNSSNKKWGFSSSSLRVERQKINHNTWKLTVQNPRTNEKILEVEGSGDTLFANEDHLARMAEAITQEKLKITTNFD